MNLAKIKEKCISFDTELHNIPSTGERREINKGTAYSNSVFCNKKEFCKCTMKRKENTRLGHIMTQVVFHMGEKLPKWLQQGEVTVPEKRSFK